jgi:hypothetical protein
MDHEAADREQEQELARPTPRPGRRLQTSRPDSASPRLRSCGSPSATARAEAGSAAAAARLWRVPRRAAPGRAPAPPGRRLPPAAAALPGALSG